MDPNDQESELLPADSNANNPYASSSVSERPELGPVSALAMLGIAVLTLLSSGIAFCCTCFPVGYVALTFSLGQQGSNLAIGNTLFVVAWAGGALVAILVGYFVARALWRRQQAK